MNIGKTVKVTTVVPLRHSIEDTDRALNTIKELEHRAITCASEVESECLVTIADAIEEEFELAE